MQSTSRTVGEWGSPFSPLQWRPWEAGVRTLWSSSMPSVTISPPGLASLQGKYLTIFSRDFRLLCGASTPRCGWVVSQPFHPWWMVWCRRRFSFSLSLFFVSTPLSLLLCTVYPLSPSLPLSDNNNNNNKTIIIIIIFLVGRRAPNHTATASNESVTTGKI